MLCCSTHQLHKFIRKLPRPDIMSQFGLVTSRMRKLPKTRDYRSMLGTGIKVVVVAEGLFLVGSYALWRSMNTSRDFRRKVYDYCPMVLESYYWMGETLGNLPTRRLDYEAWGVSRDK